MRFSSLIRLFKDWWLAMDVGIVDDWGASFLNCNISHHIIRSFLSITMVQRQADFFLFILIYYLFCTSFHFTPHLPHRKLVQLIPAWSAVISLIVMPPPKLELPNEYAEGVVSLWTCLSLPIIVCVTRIAVQVFRLPLEFSKFFSWFLIANGPWQVNMWFQPSLGVLQTRKVWVSCCLWSKTILLNPHWLLSNLVSSCWWAREVLFIASWESSHSMRFGSFGSFGVSSFFAQ